MSKFIKIPSENCLPCDFYESCFLDGVGTELNEPCTKGFVWQLKNV